MNTRIRSSVPIGVNPRGSAGPPGQSWHCRFVAASHDCEEKASRIQGRSGINAAAVDGREQQTDPAAVARVSKLVRNVIGTIGMGVARFDAFGWLGFVSRIGFEPEPETDESLERRYEETAPIIENTVRRTLPWLLSREISQRELPL
jgi:hypothetical protein